MPDGVTYNSYLIVDEKVTLIDPVEAEFMSEYLYKIKSILGTRKVDYLVVNHDEPDHSGSVYAIIKEYPEIQVVGNAKTFGPLEAFYGSIENKKIVADGESLSIGKHALHFYTMPMVHWPESMATYDETTGIVFSNDAFGGFGTLNGSVFDDEADMTGYEDEMLRYYANIVGKVSAPTMRALQKVATLKINMIAPSHGIIWRKNIKYVVDKYLQWAQHQGQKGLVIAYGTMYGNTARMADIIAKGAADAGVKEIKIYDVSKTNMSYIMRDVWKYTGVCLGVCAHYNSMFPPMSLLTYELTDSKPQNKFYGIFGGMSFSGGGVKTLNAIAESAAWNVVSEPVEVKGAPIREEDVEKLYNLGMSLGQKL